MLTSKFESVCGAIGLVAVLVALVGCGKSDGMISVTGLVTYNGDPVQDGSISFTPVDGRGSSGGGMIENGQIIRGKSSPGKIAVQIYANKIVEKKNPTAEEIERGITSDRVQYLPGPYNQQSKLRITISDSERHFDFDLNNKGEIPVGMTGE
ncbi:hypothetical protein M4951_03965 [Blastopirellula sp. J2-11]|uniref:hypothetical protein n=1 Tax=Blastopirellula sp. J2-11 TaxID=2943192 RepID=UPI0021C7E6F8|nr:hypothetical protein [Blastopirellula sp. J2-11]UUO07471.1 hypothetical protein M4951_03965 [Blastopirellula sp. J2-11]